MDEYNCYAEIKFEKKKDILFNISVIMAVKTFLSHPQT